MRFQLKIGAEGFRIARPELAEAAQREKSRIDDAADWKAVRKEQEKWSRVNDLIAEWTEDPEWQRRDPDFPKQIVADTLAGESVGAEAEAEPDDVEPVGDEHDDEG